MIEENVNTSKSMKRIPKDPKVKVDGVALKRKYGK
jgi:hypothetical protein